MYWQKRFDRPNKDKSIEEAIKSIFEESKEAYGYRRVTAMVRKHGFIVNQKKVRRLMKKLNLKCVSFTRKSRKYNSYKGNVGTVVPNRIKQRFSTKIPYQKITTDTSEFKIYTTNTSGKVMIKKAYFDVFLDMYNGEVLSYRLSERPNAQAINDALREAIEITRICPYRRTFHSDQGWAYQMKQYSNTLKENRIFQSMSRKGTCLDNSPMENFFGLLKQEMYYGKTYTSFEELNNAINNYIYFYNNKRIKEKLGWCSPVEFRLLKEPKLA